MNLTSKLVRRFVRKELKWTVDFYSVQDYLQGEGYTVIFYNTKIGDTLISTLDLTEYAKAVHAFTLKTQDFKAVFVDMKLPTEDKLYSLLHEAAHIYLEHIDTSDNVSNKRLEEMEADAFAHRAISYAKFHSVLKSSLKLSAPAITLSAACLLGSYNAAPHSPATAELVIEATEIMNISDDFESSEISAMQSDTVCVTHSGTKFHHPDCHYVKGKTYLELERSSAQKHYEPCLVCNP